MVAALTGPVTPAPDPVRRDPRDVVMQRVRVGITGLAAVFLLTLLAASLLSLLGQDTRSASSPAATAAANVAADSAPREPLAELGVAPGNNPKTPPPATPAKPAFRP